MNKLSEKEKIIQEQTNLIREKKAAEMFEEKERSHEEMAKRLEESETTSTRAAKS